MRINELDAITNYGQLTNSDVYAIDTPNGTYKIPKTLVTPVPFVVDIPTSRWSGSNNDYYITVTESSISTDSILVPLYDNDSRALLNGAVWCIPASGSFTIHTSAIPSGTVKIVVLLPGNMGEAQYEVLADVYSKSQAVAKADIVNNLTSTATDKPGSANMLKTLNDNLTLKQNKLSVKRVEFEKTINANGDAVINGGDIALEAGVQTAKFFAVIIEGVRPKTSWAEVDPSWYYNKTQTQWGVHNRGTGGVAIIDIILMYFIN